MIQLNIEGKSFDLPENWEEVAKLKRYPQAAAVMYMEGTEAAIKLKLLCAVAAIDGYALGEALQAGNIKQRTEQAMHITDFTALQIMEEVYPVLDFIKKPFEENPLPVIDAGYIKLYGPAKKLEKQTGAEMEECGWAFAEYGKTGDVKYLNQLIAAMYRPKRFMLYGTVLPFKKEHTERYLHLIATLPYEVKLGVLLYHQLVDEWWAETFSDLYEGGSGAAADGEGEATDSLAISRIIRQLAGAKRGTVEEVRLLTRDEIYFEMMELERERLEIEAARK